MVLAIDFDGTIVEHAYPKIGRPMPFAIETLLQLQRDGHRLLLWSVREGDQLQEALDYCSSKGLEFYAANKNHPDEDVTKAPRKLDADIYIDDRGVGGLPDWGVIYNAVKAMSKGKTSYEEIMAFHSTEGKSSYKKKNFLIRLGEALSKNK